MATYEGTTSESVDSGTLDSGSATTYSEPTTMATIESDLKTGVVTDIESGTRTFTRMGFVAQQNPGQVVSSIVITNPVEFSLLQEQGLGTLSSVFDLDGIYLVEANTGALIRDIDQGISTVGIGYKPDIAIANDRSIRRWPRDWHGDNMKD